MQTELFSELKQALETMLSRIEAGEDILEQLERIDALHQELAPAETQKICCTILSGKVIQKR